MVSTLDYNVVRIERSGFEHWPGSLCCVPGHFTLAVPAAVSHQETRQFKWVPVNCHGNLTKMLRMGEWVGINHSALKL